MTVVQLKSMILNLNNSLKLTLKTTGSKSQLIERIVAHRISTPSQQQLTQQLQQPQKQPQKQPNKRKSDTTVRAQENTKRRKLESAQLQAETDRLLRNFQPRRHSVSKK